ncbi:MAG: hypothetical protein ACR2MG_04590 [Pyrinomonadaceae bacterium]
MKRKKQTPDALEQALQLRIQGTRHTIKFISGFVLATLKSAKFKPGKNRRGI